MVLNLSKKVFSKITTEIERGIKLYFRNGIWLLSDIISTPFWVIFLFLTIVFYAQYLLKDVNALTSLMWGIFIFILMNSFIWAGNSIVQSVTNGIVDGVILTNTNITIHLLGRSIMSVFDSFISGIIALLTASYIFGSSLLIHNLPLFFASLIIALIFYSLFASVYAALIVSLRSPWIVSNVLNFILPFLSGAIPPQLFPKSVANILLFSPFYYISGQIVSAATGIYLINPTIMLIISIIITVVIVFISNFISKKLIQSMSKEGKASLI